MLWLFLFFWGVGNGVFMCYGYWIINNPQKKTFLGAIVGMLLSLFIGLAIFVKYFSIEMNEMTDRPLLLVLGALVLLFIGWVIGGNLAYALPRPNCLRGRPS